MADKPLEVADLNNRFNNLFRSGKLVQIHVSKWGMSYQLSEEDLGLAPVEGARSAVPDFIQLGKKMLFTNDVRLKFSRIESAARRYLKEHSHKFPIADAHFVNQKALIKVMSALNQFKADYEAATNEFILNYEKNKLQMFELYPDHRKTLEPYYPQVENVRSKFGFSISIFEISFPKKLKNVTLNEVLAQNLAVEAAQKKYEAQMQEQFDNSVKQMEAFVKEAALGMRGQVIEIFDVIAKKIQNREVVSTTNLKTLKSVIDEFDVLDFLNDAKVKEQLSVVKRLVNSGADFSSDAALEKLQAAVTTTLETAKNMTDVDALTGGYIRNLDLGDDL